jgi:hypothetical protein
MDDFDLLPQEKKDITRMLRHTHGDDKFYITGPVPEYRILVSTLINIKPVWIPSWVPTYS